MGRKFFLIGGYSHGNPGDEAILKSTVYRLSELCPGARFFIWTENRRYRIQFDRKIHYRTVCWRPYRWMFETDLFSKCAVNLYSRLFPLSKRLLRVWTAPRPSFLRLAAASDKIILVGGGYLNSYYGLLRVNFILDYLRPLGKPIVLLGQTLGPFLKPEHRRMADEIFSAAQKIVLRDDFSGREVSRYRDKVLYGTDDAIGFRPFLSEADRARVLSFFNGHGSAVNVGVNLLRGREWRKSSAFYRELAAALARLKSLSGGRELNVFFLPMETSRYCDDRREGRTLERHLRGICRYAMIQDDWSVEAKHYFLGQLDLFIGMRLHSLVFSLNECIPAIGVYHNEYYFRKVCGLLGTFGLEANAVCIRESGRLPEVVERSFKERDRLKALIRRARQDMLGRKLALLREVVAS